MRHIDQAWRSYEAEVLPDGAGPGQRKALRNAFYAGALTLFKKLTNGTNEVATRTDVESLLLAFDAELGDFLLQLHASVVPRQVPS